MSFSEWLEQNNDAVVTTCFSEWLNQHEDSI